MSDKSTSSAKRAKLAKASRPKYKKPRPDFPLTPHPSGRWCKRVRGVLCYFGKIDGDENGQAALGKWLDDRDDLMAGRKPRKRNGDESTVGDLRPDDLQALRAKMAKKWGPTALGSEVVTRIRARSGLMMVGLGDRQDEREA